MRYAVIALLALLCSCTGTRMVETNLYFGQSKPGGGSVTEAEWSGFKEKHIAKVFKEGSSVTDLTGHWYDSSAKQLITEPTFMVTYYHRPAKEISKQIDSLRFWYKGLFNQQSVLRIDRTVKASF